MKDNYVYENLNKAELIDTKEMKDSIIFTFRVPICKDNKEEKADSQE